MCSHAAAVPTAAPRTDSSDTCEVGCSSRARFRSLFTRGETQALATLDLGTKEDMQALTCLFEQTIFNRFHVALHFPPFSVGEGNSCARPGRRENRPRRHLAQRALVNLLPPERDFPTPCASSPTF